MSGYSREETKPSGSPPVGADIDWESVLAKHEGWLRTIIYARVGEAQAVDEVMQEVALAAVRQKSPLLDPAKVSPWLYRLAVTQSLLYRRKRGRQRKLTESYAEAARPSEESRGYDPLGWMLSDERRGLVRTALSRIAPRDAEILLLKHTEDWSYQEIAEHLGISRSAVQARLHRARERLRRELASLEVIDSET